MPGSQYLTKLVALSPLDGRYARSVDALRVHFSESALIRYRLRIEIDQTNAAFARSKVNMRIRLVLAVEVNFVEGTMGVDLGKLQAKGDGYLDELHTLRDQYGADFVSLWTTDYT